jgi:hypothetical protein
VSRDVVLRVLAALGATVLAGQPSGRIAPALAGAAAAFAAFGGAGAVFPGPAEAAAAAGLLALLLALGARRVFPAISEEAARTAALAAGGAGAAALVIGRRLPAGEAFALVALAVLAVSAFAAESCRAGGEAGWREGVARTLSVAAPAALGAGLSEAIASAGPSRAPWVGLAALAASVLVWTPAILAESARVKAELVEEVGLGLLTEEDAVVLRLPWTRRFEKRFGRTDERREYVRSALLLAAARHQQRHRKGEAERLRQLEVLTFRTRLRRTQDARSARFRKSESGEFAPESGPPEA